MLDTITANVTKQKNRTEKYWEQGLRHGIDKSSCKSHFDNLDYMSTQGVSFINMISSTSLNLDKYAPIILIKE